MSQSKINNSKVLKKFERKKVNCNVLTWVAGVLKRMPMMWNIYMDNTREYIVRIVLEFGKGFNSGTRSSCASHTSLFRPNSSAAIKFARKRKKLLFSFEVGGFTLSFWGCAYREDTCYTIDAIITVKKINPQCYLWKDDYDPAGVINGII